MKASETLISLGEPLNLSRDMSGDICAEYWHCEVKEEGKKFFDCKSGKRQ